LPLNKFSLYWNTIRYLKPSQVYGRLFFNWLKPGIAQVPKVEPRSGSGKWIKPAEREPSMVGAFKFNLLGQTGDLQEIDWNGSQMEKLWRYNQHYFDDLNAGQSSERTSWHKELIEDWIVRNPLCKGIGWEPYPTSLRIVNWIKWANAGNVLSSQAFESLATQAEWLSKRVERHLLGNHLLANAKALVFAGLFFDGKSANNWLAEGLEILMQEIPEQILEDGAHFERSTMYHALVYEDALDLFNMLSTFDSAPSDLTGLRAELLEKIPKMGAWLNLMCHPDGEISFFNDAALGMSPTPGELANYAQRLGLGQPTQPSGDSRHLPDSGYVRLGGESAVALLDCAHLGPDYLPGHGHADSLSFELSIHGQRVIVNGGTSTYEPGERRLRERGTSSHSTVEIDDDDSSEVWGSFRVARRARPTVSNCELVSFPKIVSCSHDGYARLPGKPIHDRSWELHEKELKVSDQVLGGKCSGVSRYIVHPSVKVESVDDCSWLLTLGNGREVRFDALRGSAEVDPAHYAPRFGQVLNTQCICVKLDDGKAITRLSWD
jgi:uncharacterized heparinase superfamily protein